MCRVENAPQCFGRDVKTELRRTLKQGTGGGGATEERAKGRQSLQKCQRSNYAEHDSLGESCLSFKLAKEYRYHAQMWGKDCQRAEGHGQIS